MLMQVYTMVLIFTPASYKTIIFTIILCCLTVVCFLHFFFNVLYLFWKTQLQNSEDIFTLLNIAVLQKLLHFLKLRLHQLKSEVKKADVHEEHYIISHRLFLLVRNMFILLYIEFSVRPRVNPEYEQKGHIAKGL